MSPTKTTWGPQTGGAELPIALMKDASRANELIGIDHEDGDRVFLEVALGERVAKFAVGEGKLPRVQAVLDDQLDDNEAYS